MDCSQPGSSVHGISPCKNTGVEKKKKEYWTGLPFPFPGDIPNPGIELGFPALADSLPLSHQESPLSTLHVLFHFLKTILGGYYVSFTDEELVSWTCYVICPR